MTTSSAQAVLDRMEADEAFAERVKDAGGPEASLDLLRGEGFEVTQQGLRDAFFDRYADALTPEQVDAIAGGMSDEDVAGGAIFAGAVGVGIGIGAAASAIV